MKKTATTTMTPSLEAFIKEREELRQLETELRTLQHKLHAQRAQCTAKSLTKEQKEECVKRQKATTARIKELKTIIKQRYVDAPDYKKRYCAHLVFNDGTKFKFTPFKSVTSAGKRRNEVTRQFKDSGKLSPQDISPTGSPPVTLRQLATTDKPKKTMR